MANNVGAVAGIHIKGQKELEAAFLDLRREVFLEMKAELIKAGQSVRVEAETRIAPDGADHITNIGEHWNRMRIGATIKGVYVAPASRSRAKNSPRPNLAGKLMQGMEHALEAKRTEVEAEFNALVDASAARNGFL